MSNDSKSSNPTNKTVVIINLIGHVFLSRKDLTSIAEFNDQNAARDFCNDKGYNVLNIKEYKRYVVLQVDSGPALFSAWSKESAINYKIFE